MWLVLLLLPATTRAFSTIGVMKPFVKLYKSVINNTPSRTRTRTSNSNSNTIGSVAVAVAVAVAVPTATAVEEETTFVMDFDARRQQRLERLNQHALDQHSQAREGRVEQPQLQQLQQPRQSPDVSKVKAKNPLGDNFLADVDQYNSIVSDAPAILLESGAGTGKTTVLAGKIAHLLRTKQVEPKHMIILSFTSRDAISLKNKAMQMLYADTSISSSSSSSHDETTTTTTMPSRESLESRLWCGTIHSFAINILRKYNSNDTPLRVISTKEVRNRIRTCLGRINASEKDRLWMYRAALEDSKQSIGTLVHYVMRCLELWKEAGVLSTPYAYSIKFLVDDKLNDEELTRDDYVELAMRLGIPQNAAVLALDIAGDYQVCSMYA